MRLKQARAPPLAHVWHGVAGGAESAGGAAFGRQTGQCQCQFQRRQTKGSSKLVERAIVVVVGEVAIGKVLLLLKTFVVDVFFFIFAFEVKFVDCNSNCNFSVVVKTVLLSNVVFDFVFDFVLGSGGRGRARGRRGEEAGDVSGEKSDGGSG